MELFERENIDLRPSSPLADRLRPKTIDEFVGQEHLVGEGKFLDRVIKKGELPSLILWGPPGTGKTTL
ncbi:MAG: replication-associated recombination protein A, partial [Deltaproteobacteria bacterium]|nr:replication-associated recombination protein A [Deltaproteobacteria bacterium]